MTIRVQEKDLGELGSLVRECWARGVFVRWDEKVVPRSYAMYIRAGTDVYTNGGPVAHCPDQEAVRTWTNKHMPRQEERRE